VTKEGVGFKPTELDQEQVQSRIAMLREMSNKEGEDTNRWGIIVIGNTSVYRPIEDHNFDEVYSEYEKSARKIRKDSQPTLSRKQFFEKISGWTRVAISGIPGIYQEYIKVLVSREIKQEIDFPSTLDTFFSPTTWDLVVATSTPDGVLILAGVLCKKDEGYEDCSKNYSKGVFNAISGHEINPKSFEKKGGGVLISTKSYRVESPSSEVLD
jgi:hypothetical protein